MLSLRCGGVTLPQKSDSNWTVRARGMAMVGCTPESVSPAPPFFLYRCIVMMPVNWVTACPSGAVLPSATDDRWQSLWALSRAGRVKSNRTPDFTYGRPVFHANLQRRPGCQTVWRMPRAA